MSADSPARSSRRVTPRPGTGVVIAAVAIALVTILFQLLGSTKYPATEQRPTHSLLLDINQADVARLRHLPGIGPQLAQRIVDHRITDGEFSTIDDLEEVRGIGPRTLQRMRPFLLDQPGEVAGNDSETRQTALK